MAGVQSIERAFAVLRAVAPKAIGVTDIAATTKLPKSTVSRLLGALETEGAVEQVESGGDYRLGPLLAELVKGAAAGFDFAGTSQPVLADLSRRLGETSGISTLDDGWVFYVAHVEGDGEVLVRDWTGEWAPAHAVPSGLVMLAHSPPAVVDELVARGLDSVMPATVTEPEMLRDRIDQIRNAGYAWGLEEFAEGINSVAAPVFANEVLVGAIHVHGPSYRFPDRNRMHDIGLVVATAGEVLSSRLSD